MKHEALQGQALLSSVFYALTLSIFFLCCTILKKLWWKGNISPSSDARYGLSRIYGQAQGGDPAVQHEFLWHTHFLTFNEDDMMFFHLKTPAYSFVYSRQRTSSVLTLTNNEVGAGNIKIIPSCWFRRSRQSTNVKRLWRKGQRVVFIERSN